MPQSTGKCGKFSNEVILVSNRGINFEVVSGSPHYVCCLYCMIDTHLLGINSGASGLRI